MNCGASYHKFALKWRREGAAAVFYGQHYHSIDKKGRVFVPAKYREELGDKFMLSRSPDGKYCLCIYPMEEWKRMDERLKTLPGVKSGKLLRFLYAGAEELQCDSQGRILVPQNLREYANLDGDTAIVGMSTKLEIWNGDAFKAEEAAETAESIAELAESLGF